MTPGLHQATQQIVEDVGPLVQRPRQARPKPWSLCRSFPSTIHSCKDQTTGVTKKHTPTADESVLSTVRGTASVENTDEKCWRCIINSSSQLLAAVDAGSEKADPV